MGFLRHTALWVLACLVFFAGPGAAIAAETITRFNSLVRIAADGDLTVTETISVVAEGNQIKRGIYRDFPLYFEGPEGGLHEVGFDLVSVKRGGRDEPYFIEYSDRFLRIYIGESDISLRPGAYTYEIVYQTDRQIRYFDTYDELLWNATGNGWDFPIEDASAVVELPNGGVAEDVVYFTGPQGATDRNARASLEEGGNRVVFSLTEPLGKREGLTVGVKMAKGVVAPPNNTQKAVRFWREHGASVLAVVTLIVVFLYYYWAWRRVGRDPQRGAVVPRWDPPEGISPALSAYIHDRGFAGKGWDAMSGAVINLAVKGYVILDNLQKDLVIRRTAKAAGPDLPVGEKALLREVGDGEISIDKSNASEVRHLHNAFISSVEAEHRSEFYKANTIWIVLGIVLSVVGLVMMLAFASLDPDTMGFLLIALIFGVAFMVLVMTLGRSIKSAAGLGGKIKNILLIGLFGVVALPNILIHVSSFVLSPRDPYLMAAIAGLIMVNILFYFLIGAPTPIGQRMAEGIEGLKTYLQLAEKDRMNLAGAPTMSPGHFETLLPYAVALGVEKPWSNAFEAWLASAAAAGIATTYSPLWQQGIHSSGTRIGDSFGSIGKDMGSSFTASMPAPKSSSSGFSGGGSSGGGGGGGGGGGW